MLDTSIEQLIDLGLSEDIGAGDHSSLACIDPETVNQGEIFAKEDGVIYGTSVALRVFEKVDPKLQVTVEQPDGSSVKKGDVVLRLKGNPQSILTGERLALNFLQRLSGIATTTNRLVQLCNGKTTLLDTRKTTPGFRILEKAAVKAGGGGNHRMGLHDMIMLKDNHLDYAGGIAQAIDRCHAYIRANQLELKIEVEVRDFAELDEVLQKGGIDRIMLDNFSPDDISKALTIIGGKYETEASGGITEATLPAYAATGVDFISIGALTHSVKSLDLSLLVHAE